MAEELGCTYINVFDCLLDEKGNLKAEYTIEGMHMYANGYAVVLEKADAVSAGRMNPLEEVILYDQRY